MSSQNIRNLAVYSIKPQAGLDFRGKPWRAASYQTVFYKLPGKIFFAAIIFNQPI